MTTVKKVEFVADEEGAIEISKVASTEAQALDTATHDAGAHVEQAGTYQEAEAVEAAVAQLAETAAASPDLIPENDATPPLARAVAEGEASGAADGPEPDGVDVADADREKR